MHNTATPGPWLVATSNSWRRIVSQRGDVVCGPCNQPDGHPDLTFPNGGAEGPDARALVAVPEMLQALQAVAAFIDGVPDAPEPFGLVREAIKKATGGKP